ARTAPLFTWTLAARAPAGSAPPIHRSRGAVDPASHQVKIRAVLRGRLECFHHQVTARGIRQRQSLLERAAASRAAGGRGPGAHHDASTGLTHTEPDIRLEHVRAAPR